MTLSNFGKWVRHNRKRLGVTLLVMAEDFGTKPSLMCDYEVGRKEYPPRLAALIRHYFDMVEAEKTPAEIKENEERREKIAEGLRDLFKQAGVPL